jgi:acetylornithine/succinyldiaminopimelate/putrescine aminotransferase
MHKNYKKYVNPFFGDVISEIGGYCSPWYSTESDARIANGSFSNIIDCFSGFGTVSVGHRNDDVWTALQKWWESGRVNINAFSNFEMQGDLAREILTFAGVDEGLVYFANSGSEAVESVMRVCEEISGRRHFVSLQDGFHGASWGTRHLSGSGDFSSSDYHFTKCDASLNTIEAIFTSSGVAAIFVEPFSTALLSNGLSSSVEFITGLRELCSRHGVFLVFDEMWTAGGRTGKAFGFHHWPDFFPDMVVGGKAFSGGITPFSFVIFNITASRGELVQFLGQRAVGSTFGGNALSLLVAHSVLGLIKSQDLSKNSQRTGEIIGEAVRQVADVYEGMCHGEGLMWTICTSSASDLWFDLLDAGLLTGLVSRQNPSIRVAPNLCIDETTAKEVAERLRSLCSC